MGIRKSVFRLSETERDNFLAALLTLKNTIANPGDPPAQQISIYDQFVAIHLCVLSVNQPGTGSSVNVGHQNSGFGPWHRYFLLSFEQALQAVDPTVNLPYWDWTDHTGTENILFQDNFIGPNGGGGSGGNVASGFFSFNGPAMPPAWWPAGLPGWRVRPELEMSNGTTLRRFLDPFTSLATATHVDTTMSKPTYEGGAGNSFRSALEAGSRMHNSGHNWVGGHMGDPDASPNDPIFFLHHANVDRLWAMWQIDNHDGPGNYPAAGRPVGHNLNDPMWPWVGALAGFSTNNLPAGIVLPDFSGEPVITPADMIDHRSLGYAYDTEVIVGVALDQTGSMDGATPDPMTGMGSVSKWVAAKQGVSAMLQDAEAAYSAREAYVIGGVQTFRSVGGNIFTKLSPGTPSGIVKSGSPHGQTAFDAAIAVESPGGGTPLADTLVNTESDLVRAPFGNQPANEQRYLIMLTDGINTAGTPLSALSEPEFPDSIIFAMGFGVGGGWDGVDYTTIADITTKGKGAPMGVQQVFHGENAGEIDKFFTNSIAAAIGYVPTIDPVYELFPGENTPTAFFATDADQAFMITGQGYNFSNRDWHFALKAPDGSVVAHTFSMASQPADHPFRVTLTKRNGRCTLFLTRNGASSEAWVGKWRFIVFYRSTPVHSVMLMPSLSNLLTPSGSAPVRGQHYIKSRLPKTSRKALRMIPPIKKNAFPTAVRGIGGARPKDPCSVSVNIYARTRLNLSLDLAVERPIMGEKIQFKATMAAPINGAVRIDHTVGRVIGPNYSLGAVLADPDTIPYRERSKFLLKKRSEPPRFDVVAYLAEYEHRKPGAFPKLDQAIALKSGQSNVAGSIKETNFPGVYRVALYVEGHFDPAPHMASGDCCKPPVQPFSRIVSSVISLGIKPERKYSTAIAQWQSQSRLVVAVKLADAKGNFAGPFFTGSISINGKSVQTSDVVSKTDERLFEIRFFGRRVKPSKDGQSLAVEAGVRTIDGKKLVIRDNAPLALQISVAGLELPVPIASVVGDIQTMKAYAAGTQKAMKLSTYRRKRFMSVKDASEAGFNIED